MLCSRSQAQTPTQTLRGGLNYSDHSAFNGYFVLSLAKPTVINTCSSPAQVIPAPSSRVIVTDSVLTPVQLVPTSCLQPSLPYYVQLFDSTGTLIYTDNWYIPRSADGNTYIGTLTSVQYAAGITVSLPQAIVSTPVGTQNIVQPAGTTLHINNATIDNLTGGGGTGNVGTSGSPTSGQTAQFSGPTTITGVGSTGTGNYVRATIPVFNTGLSIFGCASGTFVKADVPGCAVPPGGGGGSGTMTSAALTLPSWLNVTGSPITTSGTFAVTATGGQPANQFLRTPNGSAGPLALGAIVAADIPVLTSAQVPAQYKIKPCGGAGIGDGQNIIPTTPTATYPINYQCYNDYGVTYTITSIQCASAVGSPTVTVADNSGNALLTGPITANSTWAAGTQSATTTLAAGAWVNWSFVADGVSKQIQCKIKGTI